MARIPLSANPFPPLSCSRSGPLLPVPTPLGPRLSKRKLSPFFPGTILKCEKRGGDPGENWSDFDYWSPQVQDPLGQFPPKRALPNLLLPQSQLQSGAVSRNLYAINFSGQFGQQDHNTLYPAALSPYPIARYHPVIFERPNSRPTRGPVENGSQPPDNFFPLSQPCPTCLVILLIQWRRVVPPQ